MTRDPPDMRVHDSPKSTIPMTSFERPPERIGPYKILETIGEGGMGTVYLAEQTEPVHRKVALKVIKLGMDTKEVVGRFEAERQALAMMDHPNIAKVFDAGATPEGRPFFAMEYVPGISITDYCDRNRLTNDERLRLFIPITQAIHHAHQKAIIHRDIKASNILISSQDDSPIPKVIDFGVAKATGHKLTERTVFTEQGMLIGTPEYMSPEQAEMTGLNVDTRTDVYSLGVLLYELLTGVLPFDSRALRKAGLKGIQHKIREEEPPRPSTRVSTLGEGAIRVATYRKTLPEILVRQIRGELDWIIIRAMEKDRTRRYQSAFELGGDICRYLSHEPVLAGPPSATYRVRKFVRRNRVGVSFASLVLIMIVALAGAMTVQANRIAKERDRANLEAETAREVSDFLVGMFEVVDPSQALGETITAKEILDEGADKIERELAGHPVIQARLMDSMGKVYASLGLLDKSESLLEVALKTREEELGADHPEVAETLYNTGVIYQGTHSYNLTKALEVFERSRLIRESRLGSDHIDTAWSTYRVGSVNAFLGNLTEAMEHLRSAQKVFERKYPENHFALAWCETDMGAALHIVGRNDEAIPFLERALNMKRAWYEPNHPDLANGMNALGYVLTRLGRFEEAEPLAREAVDIHREINGARHPDYGQAVHSLGELCRAMGNYSEALKCFETSLAVMDANLVGEVGLDRAEVLWSLGSVHHALNDHINAENYLLESIATYEKVTKPGEPEHPYLIKCLDDYATVLRESGREHEARVVNERADAIRRRVDK